MRVQSYSKPIFFRLPEMIVTPNACRRYAGLETHPTTVSFAVGWLSKPPKQLKPAVMARLKRSLKRGNLLFHQSCHCETDAVSRGNLLVV